MRLTQGMCSIAECAAPGGDGPAARPRLVKIAVVGGSGVGKTGEGGARRRRGRKEGWKGSAANACVCLPAALVVRFLTRRFIGDYERNAGGCGAAGGACGGVGVSPGGDTHAQETPQIWEL